MIKNIQKEYKIDNQALDYLLKYHLRLASEDIINDKNLSAFKSNKLLKAVKSLALGIPIQYVVGNVNFYGHEYKIKKGVLIPRFETEELVDYTINFIKKYFPEEVKVLDIGSGSGVIGLTIKKELAYAEVTLIDISKKAINLTEENANLIDVKVKVYKSNMLSKVITSGETFNIVISNPPYLRYDEEIMDVVLTNEPKKALFGGNDGLKYYREIFKNLKKVITDKALLALEIDSSQKEAILLLVKKYFPNDVCEVIKDMQGRDRMFFLFHNLID